MSAGRIGSYIRRIKNITNRILGPSQPIDDLDIPLPKSSIVLSTTIGEKSYTFEPDKFFNKISIPLGIYPFLCLWIGLFIILVRQQYYLPNSPQIISCTAAPWNDFPPDTCGLNGTNCLNDLTEINDKSFRCLGGCKNSKLGNSRYIGSEKINNVPLVIGGGDVDKTYRADSWVCSAALHSSIISSSLGGCINFHSLPHPEGYSNYLSSNSHSINSTAFEPHYPGAFRLSKYSSINGCLDLHYIVTGFNAFCLLLTTLLLKPRLSLSFIILLVLGYFHLILFANPPNAQSPNWETIFARLTPTLIAGYWMYKISFKRTLIGFRNLPFEIAIWQGAGFWIGIESSTIFNKLPITRLGYDSLDPAGIISLVIIIVIVVIIGCIQAWQMRKYGLLRYYLYRYIPLVPLLIILAVIPNYSFRPHHYLLALLGIPVVSLPNRISLFLQAFFLGLFLDGTGRWGWDGIIQLTGSLVGDANTGSFVPSFWSNLTTSTTLFWDPVDVVEKIHNVTSYSILIDDIQHFANYTNRSIDMTTLGLTAGIDHFVRLAFIANGTSLDITKPVTWHANSSWSQLWDVV
ncbi:uncharacterized protein L201_007471 [Kwoniella dendrophila CBS 6074]|uniref:LCCL domain-containing protein n=1 Tax=Kwoniella dendrophila CBS 6074 TaxID=1295534 RepID=A0AAX4K4M2_9TREE